MVSDQSDLDNSQIGADDNDIEDEYETVRRQCAENVPALRANDHNHDRYSNCTTY